MMGDIVYVDIEDGKKRVMNNAKLYVKLLAKFRDEPKIEAIFDALDLGNLEEAQVLVHTAKGVTANLSIKELNLKIQELEAQIKARSVAPETIAAVKSCFAETMPHIEKVIADNA